MEAKQKRGAKPMLNRISKDMIGAPDHRLDAMVDKKLLIFDTDGTLRRCTVRDQGCPNRNGQWEIIPWAREALARVPIKIDHPVRPGTRGENDGSPLR